MGPLDDQRTAKRLSLAVPEAWNSQDARQVMDVVTSEPCRQRSLNRWEFMARAVACYPVAVPPAGRTLDDQMRRGFRR